MKKLFPLVLVALGAIFAVAGIYTISRGVSAKNEVQSELLAQRITTPADASMPNVQVQDIASARSMADIIDHHANTATGNLTYSEMGKFATADGKPAGTNDAAQAVKSADGKPVANGLRSTAQTAASLRTSLYSSVMAFEIATLVQGLGLLIIVLGLAIGGMGVALSGLVVPSLAKRFHVRPVVEDSPVLA